MFEILHNERGQEVHEIIWTDFLKKFLYGANRPFWARKWWVLINSGSPPRICLKFAQWKGPRGTLHYWFNINGSYINGFPEKIFIWGKWIILAWKWLVIITQDPLLRIFWKLCMMKEVKRHIKISLMVFLKNI